MLSDKDCEELAELFISFIEQAPENLVNRRVKSQIGASHSTITAGVMASREHWENTIGRFLYWINSKGIKEQTPPNDDH